jgi:hypothetical protein
MDSSSLSLGSTSAGSATRRNFHFPAGRAILVRASARRVYPFYFKTKEKV